MHSLTCQTVSPFRRFFPKQPECFTEHYFSWICVLNEKRVSKQCASVVKEPASCTKLCLLVISQHFKLCSFYHIPSAFTRNYFYEKAYWGNLRLSTRKSIVLRSITRLLSFVAFSEFYKNFAHLIRWNQSFSLVGLRSNLLCSAARVVPDLQASPVPLL